LKGKDIRLQIEPLTEEHLDEVSPQTLEDIAAFSHSWSLRQQVIPLPQPISGGKYCQGKPVLSTKMIPVRAARLGIRGRPPFDLSGSGGSSGSTTSHSSSLTIGLAMS
jgi:hypothetical protein